MDTETLYTVIKLIDNQISKVKLNNINQSAIDNLFELRNNIILKYRPDSSYDWSFKNKRLLQYFGREVKWVKP